MRERHPRVACRFSSVPCALLLLAGTTVFAADTSPPPNRENPVDVGSKTSGVGAAPAPQPSVDARATNAPLGSGPDTPGKTGLGNTDRNPTGGAGRGPGTRPNSGPYP